MKDAAVVDRAMVNSKSKPTMNIDISNHKVCQNAGNTHEWLQTVHYTWLSEGQLTASVIINVSPTIGPFLGGLDTARHAFTCKMVTKTDRLWTFRNRLWKQMVPTNVSKTQPTLCTDAHCDALPAAPNGTFEAPIHM